MAFIVIIAFIIRHASRDRMLRGYFSGYIFQKSFGCNAPLVLREFCSVPVLALHLTTRKRLAGAEVKCSIWPSPLNLRSVLREAFLDPTSQPPINLTIHVEFCKSQIMSSRREPGDRAGLLVLSMSPKQTHGSRLLILFHNHSSSATCRS